MKGWRTRVAQISNLLYRKVSDLLALRFCTRCLNCVERSMDSPAACPENVRGDTVPTGRESPALRRTHAIEAGRVGRGIHVDEFVNTGRIGEIDGDDLPASRHQRRRSFEGIKNIGQALSGECGVTFGRAADS